MNSVSELLDYFEGAATARWCLPLDYGDFGSHSISQRLGFWVNPELEAWYGNHAPRTESSLLTPCHAEHSLAESSYEDDGYFSLLPSPSSRLSRSPSSSTLSPSPSSPTRACWTRTENGYTVTNNYQAHLEHLGAVHSTQFDQAGHDLHFQCTFHTDNVTRCPAFVTFTPYGSNHIIFRQCQEHNHVLHWPLVQDKKQRRPQKKIVLPSAGAELYVPRSEIIKTMALYSLQQRVSLLVGVGPDQELVFSCEGGGNWGLSLASLGGDCWLVKSLVGNLPRSMVPEEDDWLLD